MGIYPWLLVVAGSVLSSYFVTDLRNATGAFWTTSRQLKGRPPFRGSFPGGTQEFWKMAMLDRIRFIGGTDSKKGLFFRAKFQGISPENMASNMVQYLQWIGSWRSPIEEILTPKILWNLTLTSLTFWWSEFSSFETETWRHGFSNSHIHSDCDDMWWMRCFFG